MKFYQAVYQTDTHGFNMVYSRNIWKEREDAEQFLYELEQILWDGPSGIYSSWVMEVVLDESE